ncbi:MAG: alpha/beta fold hydrolase [Gemmatimonadales bacterium]
MRETAIELTVSPDDCDGAGTVGFAAFVRFFERAKWEHFRVGPGQDVFERHGLVVVVRRSVVDFHLPVRPGDPLRVSAAVTHLGRTSLTMRHLARRVGDELVAATAEFVLVCVDRVGQPQPLPKELSEEYPAPAGTQPIDRVSVNGVNLAIEVEGTGPAVVFLHGFPLDRTIWRHQLETLTGYRRVAIDLRGMGQSDAPDLGYSMGTYADDVAGVLDSLGESQVVLCGLSMGGYIAFEFVRRYRARLRGLVLMGTRAEADSAEGRKARDSLVAKVRDQGTVAAAEAMLPRFFTPGVPRAIIERVRDMILRAPVAGVVGALTAMRDRPDSSPQLGELTGMPCLVVVGQEDVITPPAISRGMAKAIPDARLVEIPGAGHLPGIEQPVPTTRAILKFLQSLR